MGQYHCNGLSVRGGGAYGDLDAVVVEVEVIPALALEADPPPQVLPLFAKLPPKVPPKALPKPLRYVINRIDRW